MRAAGVRHRVHAGRQREEAGKSGAEGEDRSAKFRLLACLGRKKGHSIRRISRDLKTAYSTIRDWLLRMRDRGLKGILVQREAQGAKSQAPSPDHPYRAALAQEEPEKVWL